MFSLFSSLSPFVQFVGRIMRVIKQNEPGNIINHASVIFHAGANIAKQWSDFQEYSEANRDFFNKLLPMENLDFNSNSELEVDPMPKDLERKESVNVCAQSHVQLQEIPLISDPRSLEALQVLREEGWTLEDLKQSCDDSLQPLPVTKQHKRRAMRASLDMRVRNETTKVLKRYNLNSQGRDLDKQYLGQSNFVVVKSAIDRHVNTAAGHQSRKRHKLSIEELDKINSDFPSIVERAVEEIFDATN